MGRAALLDWDFVYFSLPSSCGITHLITNRSRHIAGRLKIHSSTLYEKILFGINQNISNFIAERCNACSRQRWKCWQYLAWILPKMSFVDYDYPTKNICIHCSDVINEYGDVSNHRRLDCLLNRSSADQIEYQSPASLAFF